MASKKRRRQFATQAAQEALLRFGPELSGLKAAEQSYRGDYRAARNQAQAGAEATQAAIAQYAPALAAMFDQTGLATANAAQRLRGADLEGLGAVADSIKAGASLEAEGATNRMNALKAMSVGELVRGAALAPQAAQFSIGQARQTRDTNLGKVAERRRDIEQEIGAFTQSRAGELGQEAAQRALTNRINLRSVRGQARRQEDAQAFDAEQNALDRQNARTTARLRSKGSKSESAAEAFEQKYGVKKATTEAHRSLVKSINNEMDRVGLLVRKAKKDGKSRAEIDFVLRKGIERTSAQTVHDPATGRVRIDPKTGTAVKTQASAGLKPVSALERGLILDLVFDGHVSGFHADRLHRQGYSVQELGLPGTPRKKRRRRSRGPYSTGPGHA